MYTLLESGSIHSSRGLSGTSKIGDIIRISDTFTDIMMVPTGFISSDPVNEELQLK